MLKLLLYVLVFLISYLSFITKWHTKKEIKSILKDYYNYQFNVSVYQVPINMFKSTWVNKYIISFIQDGAILINLLLLEVILILDGNGDLFINKVIFAICVMSLSVIMTKLIIDKDNDKYLHIPNTIYSKKELQFKKLDIETQQFFEFLMIGLVIGTLF